MSKKYELSVEDLKVRANILKVLATVDLLTTYNEVEGELKFKSESFKHKGTMHEFGNILCSIYEYRKVENEWKILMNDVAVRFSFTGSIGKTKENKQKK